MISSEKAIDDARNGLVDDLIGRRIIRTPTVERAFRLVARHAFIPPPFALLTNPIATEFEETDDPCRLYSDTPVVVRRSPQVHCGAPSINARQIEELAPIEGMRALHVGTGCGYYTAILAELAGERGTVVGVEYADDLAELSSGFLGRAGYTTVTIRAGDGAFGVPEAAPFDRILVSAGAADIAPSWITQLADDGRLVFPFCQVGPLGPVISGGVILAVHKLDEQLFGHISTVAFFAPLQGVFAPSADEGVALAEGLQRWFALEDFLRSDLPIRIVMKSASTRAPAPASVPWLLETRNTLMWIEPN